MVKTWKQKFNEKYKFAKDAPHSVQEISDLTGFQYKKLKEIVKRGEGAFKSSPGSVRPQVKSAVQWGYARLYSSVMGGPAAKVDKDLLVKKRTIKKKKIKK